MREFRSLYLRGGLFSEFYGIYHDEFFIHSNNLHVCYILYIYFHYNGEANEKRYSLTLAPFPIPLLGREEWVWATALIPVPFRLVTGRS